MNDPSSGFNLDAFFEQKLDELVNGRPEEEILAELDRIDPELAFDFKLAAQMRFLQSPQPTPKAVLSGRNKLIGEIKNMNTTQNKPTTDNHRPQKWLFPMLAFGSAIVVLLLSVALFAGILFAKSLAQPAAVAGRTTGIVEIASEKGSWEQLAAGEKIQAGDRVRTGKVSSLVVEYADGTLTFVGPNTLLTFEELQIKGGAIDVRITQQQGSSSHRVIPFRSEKGSYTVNTPSSTARVHGTEFAVNVTAAGITRYSVDKGLVMVSGSSGEVAVTAGQTTAVRLGEDPLSPSYQFSIQGTVSAITDTQWTIAGVNIAITSETLILGGPTVGSQVYVEGRVLADGTWVADQIFSVEGEAISNMTGVVESISDTSWIISGKTFLITENTLVDENIEVADPVKVIFNIQPDGTWVALSILSLEEPEPSEPTATPEITPDLDEMPSLSFNPDELRAEICTSVTTVAGTLSNHGSEEKDFASGVRLGYEITVNPELVSAVAIDPNYWERIDAGESVDFLVKIGLSDAWNTASSGTEVKLEIFVAEEINRPDHHPGRVTVTVVRTCDGTPTPTAEFTATPTPELSPTPTLEMTPTPTLEVTSTATPEITPTPTEAIGCTGADPHPVGTKLALRYGVPYEEIMAWFCMGFGFGEIDLAYSLSLQTGVPVEEIFNLRMSGLGWGQIKKQLNPGFPPGNNPGKPGGKPGGKKKP
jgi:hypothetical protein